MVLVVCWCDAGTVLAWYWYCAGQVLVLCWPGTVTVLAWYWCAVLSWYWSSASLILVLSWAWYWSCAGLVLVLCCPCTGPVLAYGRIIKTLVKLQYSAPCISSYNMKATMCQQCCKSGSPKNIYIHCWEVVCVITKGTL